MHVRRQHLVLAFFGVAMPLTIASVALACQSLATLHANPSTAVAGVETSVTLIGSGFSRTGDGSTASAVDIRLDTLDGRALASVTDVGPDGDIRVTVAVPATTSVGYHAFTAIQTDEGAPTAGTPVRASFQVLPANASDNAVKFGPGHPHERGHPNTTRSSVLDLAPLVSPLGIAPLAASGAIGLARRRRRRATSPR